MARLHLNPQVSKSPFITYGPDKQTKSGTFLKMGNLCRGLSKTAINGFFSLIALSVFTDVYSQFMITGMKSISYLVSHTLCKGFNMPVRRYECPKFIQGIDLPL